MTTRRRKPLEKALTLSRNPVSEFQLPIAKGCGLLML